MGKISRRGRRIAHRERQLLRRGIQLLDHAGDPALLPLRAFFLMRRRELHLAHHHDGSRDEVFLVIRDAALDEDSIAHADIADADLGGGLQVLRPGRNPHDRDVVRDLDLEARARVGLEREPSGLNLGDHSHGPHRLCRRATRGG